MSNWKDLRIVDKLRAVLADITHPNPDHHFGRPFLSAYQLAILFAELNPDDVDRLGYPIGGLGTGERPSLSQYIARNLSDDIQAARVTDIEGAFLGNDRLRALVCDNRGEEVLSSLTDSGSPLSLFRLRRPA